jgi:acetyl/propionyl-CoA carboxylase alpha subunit
MAVCSGCERTALPARGADEAMRMENELRAVRDGTVAEIRVQEGATVEAGALLLAIA